MGFRLTALAVRVAPPTEALNISSSAWRTRSSILMLRNLGGGLLRQ